MDKRMKEDIKKAEEKISALELKLKRAEVRINRVQEDTVKRYTETEVEGILDKTLGGLRALVDMQNDRIDEIKEKIGMARLSSFEKMDV